MRTFQEDIPAIRRTQWRYGDGDMDAFRSITEDHERVRSLPGGPEELAELGDIRLRQFLFMIVSKEVFEGSVVKVLVCSVSV